MTDTSYLSKPADGDAPATHDSALFYVVSIQKFTVLYLITFGIYGVYWFYRNWAHYNRNSPHAARAGNSIWPLPRAIFAIFFVHDLFRKIKANSGLDTRVGAWKEGFDATIFVILLLVSSMLDRAARKDLASPTTDILSLLILLPLAHYYVKAQEMINICCGDPQGRSNERFTLANWAWIVGGGLLWCLALVGFMFPEVE